MAEVLGAVSRFNVRKHDGMHQVPEKVQNRKCVVKT